MNNKLKARDFINIGIFTVIFIILFMVFILASGIVVVTWPFGVAAAGLVLAPIYMLLVTKCPKPGTAFILFTIHGFMLFIMGSGWPIGLAALTGGLIIEIITRGKNKTNLTLQSISYSLAMVSIALGTLVPMFTMKDFVKNQAAGNAVQDEYMLQILDFLTGPVFVIAIIATFVLSLVGTFIAKLILKKHFVKAGLIKA